MTGIYQYSFTSILTLGIFSRKTSSSQKFAMHLGQRKTTKAYKKIQDGGRE